MSRICPTLYILINFLNIKTIFLLSIKSYQYPQAQKLTTGVIISPGHNKYPCGRPCKKKWVQKNFLQKSHSVENQIIPFLNTLSRTIPYLNTLIRTIPYLNTLNRTIPYLNTLNPILIHRSQSNRQPIRIEYYVTREISARVEVPSRLSTRLGSLKPILIHRDLHPPPLSGLLTLLLLLQMKTDEFLTR